MRFLVVAWIWIHSIQFGADLIWDPTFPKVCNVWGNRCCYKGKVYKPIGDKKQYKKFIMDKNGYTLGCALGG